MRTVARRSAVDDQAAADCSTLNVKSRAVLAQPRSDLAQAADQLGVAQVALVISSIINVSAIHPSRLLEALQACRPDGPRRRSRCAIHRTPLARPVDVFAFACGSAPPRKERSGTATVTVVTVVTMIVLTLLPLMLLKKVGRLRRVTRNSVTTVTTVTSA